MPKPELARMGTRMGNRIIGAILVAIGFAWSYSLIHSELPRGPDAIEIHLMSWLFGATVPGVLFVLVGLWVFVKKPQSTAEPARANRLRVPRTWRDECKGFLVALAIYTPLVFICIVLMPPTVSFRTFWFIIVFYIVFATGAIFIKITPGRATLGRNGQDDGSGRSDA